MTIVNVTIGSRSFDVGCAQGQEEHLKKLAGSVDERVKSLASSLGNSNETLLMVMTMLTMQDELNDVATKNVGNQAAKAHSQAIVADAVNTVSDYIETVADRLENA